VPDEPEAVDALEMIAGRRLARPQGCVGDEEVGANRAVCGERGGDRRSGVEGDD
jgi:hypothetical protein